MPAEFTAGVRANEYFNLPPATSNSAGVVKLDNSLVSTSSNTAATADALRRANATAIAASNTGFATSNFLYPEVAATSNIAVAASNTAFASSNDLYPRLATASNIAIAASNQAFTASAVASSNPWGLAGTRAFTMCNVAIGKSNADANTQLEVFSSAAWTLLKVADAFDNEVQYNGTGTLMVQSSNISSQPKLQLGNLKANASLNNDFPVQYFLDNRIQRPVAEIKSPASPAGRGPTREAVTS